MVQPTMRKLIQAEIVGEMEPDHKQQEYAKTVELVGELIQPPGTGFAVGVFSRGGEQQGEEENAEDKAQDQNGNKERLDPCDKVEQPPRVIVADAAGRDNGQIDIPFQKGGFRHILHDKGFVGWVKGVIRHIDGGLVCGIGKDAPGFGDDAVGKGFIQPKLIQ